MIIEFKDNLFFNSLKDVWIRDKDNRLKIFYGGNGDLYFDIFGSFNRDENGSLTATFNIKKQEEIYQYFEQLVQSIIDCEIYNRTDMELEFGNLNSSISNERNSIERREKLKEKHAYQNLVHNNTIIWYSDNIYDEKANILKIGRNYEGIKLTFIDNPDDPAFGFGIRICNSGSKYEPFNICFMNLFHQLQLLMKENPMRKLLKPKKNQN